MSLFSGMSADKSADASADALAIIIWVYNNNNNNNCSFICLVIRYKVKGIKQVPSIFSVYAPPRAVLPGKFGLLALVCHLDNL